MQIYVVSPGDTVDTIASAFQVPVASIIFDNQLVYPYQLAVGQSLLLQDGAPPQRLRSVSVNGYAYPLYQPLGSSGDASIPDRPVHLLLRLYL